MSRVIVFSFLAAWILAVGRTDGELVSIGTGTIQLPDGYRHDPEVGIDSTIGRIHKAGGVDMRYENGGMAGDLTTTVAVADQQWSKVTRTRNGRVALVMTKDGQLIANINTGFDRTVAHANFYAHVTDAEQVAEFLLIVLSFRYDEASSTTRPH